MGGTIDVRSGFRSFERSAPDCRLMFEIPLGIPALLPACWVPNTKGLMLGQMDSPKNLMHEIQALQGIRTALFVCREPRRRHSLARHAGDRSAPYCSLCLCILNPGCLDAQTSSVIEDGHRSSR